MDFVTLRTITEDLLKMVRGSKVVSTEPITLVQLENWVHQYRTVLIKQQLDKKRLISPEYVQEMVDLPVTETSAGSGLYKTTSDMPKTVFRNHEDGYTWIGNGKTEYHFMTELQYNWQQYRKYTSDSPVVFLKERTLYVNKPEDITVRGIFENPLEVMRYDGSLENTDSPYPIPMDMLPTLKQMILKQELGIEIEAPSDDKNDSDHGPRPNSEIQYR